MSLAHHLSNFVTVNGTQFYYNNEPYYIRGANYWQGMNLGATAEYGGDRFRLTTELDQMLAFGVNNLRLMASSEGPDNQPYRMRPSLQPSPGQYNEQIFNGLDYVLNEMSKRDMTAVMTLNNFWHWSGGFSQYIAWVTKNESIPYPYGNITYDEFTTFTRQFYVNATLYNQTNNLFKNHIHKVQNRVNTFNGRKYNEDPTIMSWQIANEPQLGPDGWYEDISNFIREGSPKQLINPGIESKIDEVDFLNAHNHKNIDYCTCHLWVENWGIYNASNASSLADAQSYAVSYINSRSDWAMNISKPIVMEEFGMARDAWKKPGGEAYKFDVKTTTTHKDAYYAIIFRQVESLIANKSFAGTNFWAYAGLGRPTATPNKFNMTWLGDPPHEIKGWYSVYDIDKSTINVIKTHFKNLKNLLKGGKGNHGNNGHHGHKGHN